MKPNNHTKASHQVNLLIRASRGGIIKPANGKDFTCKELHQAVGGYIEIIGGNGNCDDLIMVLNETSKLDGLEHNATATMIAHLNKWIHPSDCICGDVVLCTT